METQFILMAVRFLIEKSPEIAEKVKELLNKGNPSEQDWDKLFEEARTYGK